MTKAPFWFILIFGAILGTTSCSPWNKLAKNGSLAEKDSAASHFYSRKQYDKAHYLFEQLLPFYAAERKYHEIYFKYVDCKYHLGDLIGAMFYYDDYVSRFPGSDNAQEFTYMSAFCTYQMSDSYELDQKYSYQAIEKFQLYLGKYPSSSHVADSEKYIKEMTEKLALKAFEQAKLYQKIGHFKAAVQGFQNLLDEHPDTKLREEASWLQVSSSASLARVSIDSKKKLRFTEYFDYLKRFSEKYPTGTYSNELLTLKKNVEKDYQKFLVDEKIRTEARLFTQIRDNAQAYRTGTTTAEKSSSYNKTMAAWNELSSINPNSKYLKKAGKYYDMLEQSK